MQSANDASGSYDQRTAQLPGSSQGGTFGRVDFATSAEKAPAPAADDARTLYRYKDDGFSPASAKLKPAVAPI
jgi:hypothetical protein